MKKIAFVLFSCLILLQYITMAQSLKSDTIDVLNYNLVLDFTDFNNQILTGKASLKITPKMSINSLSLDLTELTTDSVKINSATQCNFIHNNEVLYINLPSTYSQQDTFYLDIFYHGHPISEPGGWGGFYWTNSYAYNIGVAMIDNPHNYGRVMYPCLDDFIDRASYNFEVTVKSNHTAVCGGILQNVVDNGNDTKTFFWELNEEIPTYLSSVAVGEYIAIEDTFNGINGQIPIFIYVQPADSQKAVSSFAKLKTTLSIFEDKFGPYEWPRVGYVSVPFNGGAMEHATNIAYPRFAIDGGLNYETLYAHELAHHWFGDLITCHHEKEMWINEGWASFTEFTFTEEVYGKEAADLNIINLLKDVLEYAHIEDGGYFALSEMPHDVTYGTTTYDKGALAIHSMRGYLGDSVFFDATKAFLQEFAFTDVSSEQYRDFLTDYTGIDMNGFFDAWIFNPGHLTYKIMDYTVTNNAGSYDVSIDLKQKIFERTNYADNNRLEISCLGPDWNIYTESVQFDGEQATVNVSFPVEPQILMIDYNQKLADGSLDRENKITSTGYAYYYGSRLGVTGLSDSAFVRIEHKYVAPDHCIEPLEGIVLSDKHYWNVTGVVEGDIQTTMQFEFINTTNTGIDDWLFSDSIILDSAIRVLYRPDAQSNWQEIDFTKPSANNYGFILVDTLRFGEYTFGVYDPARYDSLGLGMINLNTGLDNNISIFPNPAKNTICINAKDQGYNSLSIFTLSGKQLEEKKFHNSDTISLEAYIPGVYIIQLTGPKMVSARRKFIKVQ